MRHEMFERCGLGCSVGTIDASLGRWIVVIFLDNLIRCQKFGRGSSDGMIVGAIPGVVTTAQGGGNARAYAPKCIGLAYRKRA